MSEGSRGWSSELFCCAWHVQAIQGPWHPQRASGAPGGRGLDSSKPLLGVGTAPIALEAWRGGGSLLKAPMASCMHAAALGCQLRSATTPSSLPSRGRTCTTIPCHTVYMHVDPARDAKAARALSKEHRERGSDAVLLLFYFEYCTCTPCSKLHFVLRGASHGPACAPAV